MRRGAAAKDMLPTLLATGDDMDVILKVFPTMLTRLSVADPFLSVAILLRGWNAGVIAAADFRSSAVQRLDLSLTI
jgi:hypothetical protein